MKKIILILSVIVLQFGYVFAQNQKCDLSAYNDFVQKGKIYVVDSSNYVEAMRYYNSAKDYCPAKAKEVEQLMAEMIQKIEDERKQLKTALRKALVSDSLTQIALTESRKALAINKLLASNELPGNFDLLSELDSLDLYDWQLGHISSEIGKLVNIQILDLTHNNLRELPVEMQNLKKLIDLDLSGNYLKYFPTQIAYLDRLQSLELDNNRIDSLSSEIGHLTELKELALDNNCLKFIPKEIEKLQKLESLLLYRNCLKSIPKEVGNLKNLKTLYLFGNQITVLPPEIGQLTNLETLVLYENQLSSLPVKALTKLKNLKKLVLTDFYSPNHYTNPLQKEDVEALRKAMPWCIIEF